MYSISRSGGGDGEAAGRGSISAIYNWFENVYLCTDLNPDQYKQYLLRPSAVTKRFFQARKNTKINLKEIKQDYIKL